MRPSGRACEQMREVTLEPGYLPNAEGSCLVKFGETWVLCAATLEERVPPFLKGKGEGWLTAEYGMLPRAAHSRVDREAAKGKQSGRTQEIQRLIGRSLRAVLDLRGFGEKQMIIDCDVIKADGGTRTAAITGGFVALYHACAKAAKAGKIPSMPVRRHAAALSCALYKGTVVVDPDYLEDSAADADANFVLTDKGEMIEIQASAEKTPFTEQQFNQMQSYALEGVKKLCALQSEALKGVL